MDDYSVSSLQESRNEWCARLINILTPLILEGLKSIFDESWKLCVENDELDKYLMTFQNFLARIPKWNQTILEEETKRIVERSNCGYLNDLISCVHIIQLKSLTCMRVGNKQKKVDISIPSLHDFIHKVYINSARKVYTNIYLFEKNITPLQIQKHNRELELIVREQILNTIRENIHIENILKVYLDETIEEDVQIEEKEEIISSEPIIEETVEQPTDKKAAMETTNTSSSHDHTHHTSSTDKTDTVQFNQLEQSFNIDTQMSEHNDSTIEDTLNRIHTHDHEIRKLDEMSDDDDSDRLVIGEKIKLTDMDVDYLERPKVLNKSPIGLEEIEILT